MTCTIYLPPATIHMQEEYQLVVVGAGRAALHLIAQLPASVLAVSLYKIVSWPVLGQSANAPPAAVSKVIGDPTNQRLLDFCPGSNNSPEGGAGGAEGSVSKVIFVLPLMSTLISRVFAHGGLTTM